MTLSAVAAAAGASVFHFCKVFHAATGLKFTDYVARARVEDARQRLLNPNMRISEVAYEVGFQSLTQFNRTFKRVFGQSPSEFRARTASPRSRKCPQPRLPKRGGDRLRLLMVHGQRSLMNDADGPTIRCVSSRAHSGFEISSRVAASFSAVKGFPRQAAAPWTAAMHTWFFKAGKRDHGRWSPEMHCFEHGHPVHTGIEMDDHIDLVLFALNEGESFAASPRLHNVMSGLARAKEKSAEV